MKKLFKAGIASVLVVSLLGLAGCGGTQTAKEPAQKDSGSTSSEKVLKIGSDIAYAPMEYMNEQQKPEGFDVDLMNAIGEDMGYKVNFETATFDGLIPSLNAGKYDAVISAMTITEERAKTVLFTDKYFQATQSIAVKQGSPIKSEADLKGKKVAVQVGTTGQEVVEKMGITPQKYDTAPDALNDLINGGVEAAVIDSPVVAYFIKQNSDKNIVTISGNFDKEYYGIAIKQDNKELADKINTSLKKLMNNGKYGEIYKKWFNGEAPKL
ncbi:basic amino acid ABC transporter substrate-binding protein [Desulfitobacterium metallireducens]|uniref:ABC transporter substrate-binding protein n=1 Tax=Desulfitobacterium metallireducens DSM 15288 TaxID=871968 RepID=W0EGR6_9FIRM|nr:basic amino acid ABC transporter substrate-binding protein [Desulfitobacterium metallireducens]AHF08246.1 ABC transporter substrate-binding protein [Desulfitobacterium metallireducens DSM 15288]